MKNEVNYYAQLVELIKVHKNPAANLLKNKKQDKKDLVQWIYKQTEFLNSEKITFSTRIFYIINNIKTLPTCALDTCNKTLHNLNFSITADKTTFYTHHCCRAHIQLDKNVRAKIENTMLDKYGVKCPLNTEDSLEHRKQTNLKKYGVEFPLQSKVIQKQCNDTLKKNYGVDSSFKSPVIRNKIKNTCIKNYGVENPFESVEVRNKIKHSYKEKYGVENPMQVKEIKEKAQNTMRERYGKKSYLETLECKEITKTYLKEHKEELQQKIEATKLERYGHKNGKIFGSADVNKTMIEKYGSIHALCNHDIRLKAQSKYKYDDKYFDSSIEIAYYIWLKDNNIKFEYQPEVDFEYIINDITHKYCPDFIVDNSYIEIKGEQFFKEDGTMQNPYDHSQDEIYEAKHQCMIKNNVKILLSNSIEIISAIKHVQQKYGKNYLKQFKVLKEKEI